MKDTKLLFIVLILCLLFSQKLYSQWSDYFKTGTAVYKEQRYVIPFDLKGHKIFVPVYISGSDQAYRFILDTGSFTMIDKHIAQELHLRKGIDYQTSGEIKKAFSLKDPVSITLGNAEIQNFILSALDLSHYQEIEPDLNGFLGSNFLRFFQVTIDYQKKKVILAGKHAVTPPSNDAYVIQMLTDNQAGLPKVDCLINHYWNSRALIDTGSPFAVTFPLSFIDNFSYSEKKHFIESEGVFASWPWSPIDKNYLGKINSFKIKDLEINDFPVIFANTDDIILGKEFLSQFIVTLDFFNQKIYLLPRGQFKLRKHLYSVGLKLRKTEDNTTVVEAVWKGSPADKMGIKPGDRVLKINSMKASQLSSNDINQLLYNNRVRRIELVVKQSYREQLIILDKQDLLTLN